MARSVRQLKEEARRAEQREEWSRSIDLYLQALRLSEQSGDISLDLSLYNRIGDLYRRSGDTDEAVRFYRKAVDQYAEQGLHTGAVALCNKILRLAPEQVETYRLLGRLHASSGLAAEARKAFAEYAEHMQERGDAAAARDGYLELARELGDDELMAEVVRQMAAAGREEEARSAVREAWEEREAAGSEPDARLREVAEELDVLGTEEDGGPVEDETSAPEAAAGTAPAGERDPADAGSASAGEEDPGHAGTPSGAPADDEDPPEGVALDDILLHDPGRPRGNEASAAGEQEPGGDPRGASADPDAPPAETDAETGEADAGSAAEEADPPAGSDEGSRVDLGERIRRRLEDGDEGAAGPSPAPGDFDDMLVGFRAEAAETSGEADPDAHVELGVALRQMGLVDDAIREFQIAARTPRPPLRAFEALGECFLQKDLHSVAVRVLNRALRLPGHPDHELLGVLYQLGVAYQTVGEHGQALDCFERVFSVDIDFRDVAERMQAVRSRL